MKVWIKKFGIIALVFISMRAAGQLPKIEFGEISMHEVRMQSYEKDSSAVAVVLFDYGDLNMKDFTLHRYSKIKILRKDGYQWADVSVPIFGDEKISSFKAATYNVKDGKMEVTPVADDGRFKEEYVEGIDIVKWAFPNVKEGSLLEYEYTISNGGIRDWEFQKKIPIAHSEFNIRENVNIKFQIFIQGYLVPKQVGSDHWLMKDVPAFVDEPFISSSQNYISKVNLELANVTVGYRDWSGRRDTHLYNYMSDWPDLSKQYKRIFTIVGGVVGGGFIKEMTDSIIKDCKFPDEKVRAIHSYVQSAMEWNGRYSTWVRRKGMKRIFDDKTGTSGDINLLMLAMMRHANLPGDPVLISTRDNGFIRQEVPNKNQFNNVLILTDYNGKKKLIDATNRFLAIDFLPESCLNGVGYWVKESGFEWIEVTNTSKTKNVLKAKFVLNEEGIIKAKLDQTKYGYEAQKLREAFKKDKNQYLHNFLLGKNSKELKEDVLNLEDVTKPTSEKYDFFLEGEVVKSGSSLFFRPLLFSSIEENPFKLDERVYPVDFGFPKEEIFSAEIIIPDGYEVDELPQPKMALLPEGAGKFVYNAVVHGSVITIISQFSLNKTLFAQTEYPNLREFYNIMTAKHAEQIVLKKK